MVKEVTHLRVRKLEVYSKVLAGEEHELAPEAPDPVNLRRFAMITGMVLIAYVSAGGNITNKLSASFFPLEITRPQALLVLLCVTSVYATWRYWHYGVRAPLTRTKVRSFLRSPDSVFVFNGNTAAFNAAIAAGKSTERELHNMLMNKLPPGLDVTEAEVITNRLHTETTPDLIRLLLTKHLDKYFPGINSNDINLSNASSSNPNTIYTAYVSQLNRSTWLRVQVEDIDHYAPIILNILGLGLLFIERMYRLL